MKPFGILIAIVSVVIATVLTAVSYKTGGNALGMGEILDPWSVPRTYSDKSIYRNIPLVRSL